jgi:hypothetical protein
MVESMTGGRTIIHRNIMTYGTFEAKLAERLEGFEAQLPDSVRLAYLPAHGVIKLRLTGSGRWTGSTHDGGGTGAETVRNHP